LQSADEPSQRSHEYRRGEAVQAAAAAVGQPLLIVSASTQNEIDDAFATIKQERIGAVLRDEDPST
jgi:hypothetical protein